MPYYLKNYVFFPLLAGPFFWKVLLGNWLAETMRDVYSAATIYCGHVGDDVASYPEGTRAHGRGEWYAMQIEATQQLRGRAARSRSSAAASTGRSSTTSSRRSPRSASARSRPRSAPSASATAFRTRRTRWGRTLKKALAHVGRLGRQEGGAIPGMREAIREMA